MTTKTETITVTAEIPEKVKQFMDRFANFVGKPLETLLSNELTATIEQIYQSGLYEFWTQEAFENSGLQKYFGIKTR